MCGISGFLGAARGANALKAMTDALRHRGPDDGRVWVDQTARVGLGHRRLSIIDLSESGAQPMASPSGRFVTAFNGEIYNFTELREELDLRGVRFRGHSDTEVMLAAFDVWGIEATLPRLEGMFAAAVWDSKERRLALFRDPAGVKPLYYRWLKGALYFSSELSADFAGLGPCTIDRRALALYFRHNCVPAPHSIYAEIRKLEPSTVAFASAESVARGGFEHTRQYWNALDDIERLISGRDESMSLEAAVERTEAALSASVRKRAVADVPLGAFLSGGIDSSLVVAHLAAVSSRPVRTFTIGFSDPNFNEAPYAREIAARLGTEHTEFSVTERDALEVIPALPAMYGEPFADSSQIPTYLVSRMTRRAVTVALSGDGGDELFSGYASYRRLARVQDFVGRVPARVFSAVSRGAGAPGVRQGLLAICGPQKYEWLFNGLRLLAAGNEGRISFAAQGRSSLAERLVIGGNSGDSLTPFRRRTGNLVEQKMTDDFLLYLPDDILTKVDRASMAVSLEVRVPFVDDPGVFETAWSIPFRHKNDGKHGKLVLREALARHIPRELFERPKMGFSVPLGRWLSGPLAEWVEDMTSSSRLRDDGLLDPEVVEEIKAVRHDDDEWMSYKLWAIACFQAWRHR